MSDERSGPDWLLEPPAANEVHFHFATGDDVELSPEARQAIETLLSELNSSEVEGFRFGIWDCDELSRPSCSPDNCTLMNCQPLTTTPSCFAHSHCKIAM
ncbi:MAG TPA: hypothetical protein VGP92_18105 [Acidimicrobiia bacterium]|jgi:hypothetical protein|nr:hypothetical protein [Acidimicrobiia bacterium]